MKPKLYFYFCSYKQKDGIASCNVVRVLKLGHRRPFKCSKYYSLTSALENPRMMNKVFMYHYGFR